MEAWEAARNALECVLEVGKGEKIAIICDFEKKEIGEAFTRGALKLGLQTHLVTLKAEEDTFRREIPQQVKQVLDKPPAIYINLLRGVREETPFRIALIHEETKDHKARLGHCPGVTLDMLTEGALALQAKEHRQMQKSADKLAQKLAKATKIEVKNPSGTRLSFSVKDRQFFTDTIIDWKTMKWMNLPTGELIVAPVEDSLEGELVCGMAIGGIGHLKTPVSLTVKNGKVKNSSCKDAQVLKRVKDSLDTDENASRIGEFAFGINPKARFTEEFLEAEKMLGTIHMAFGNNSDFPGGQNPSKNHMDFLVSKPTVKAFGETGSGTDILVNGVFPTL
jgi:leucyl aminopeptidase (aminopeptidase T)